MRMGSGLYALKHGYKSSYVLYREQQCYNKIEETIENFEREKKAFLKRLPRARFAIAIFYYESIK